jgi:hypothetical protein
MVLHGDPAAAKVDVELRPVDDDESSAAIAVASLGGSPSEPPCRTSHGARRCSSREASTIAAAR